MVTQKRRGGPGLLQRMVRLGPDRLLFLPLPGTRRQGPGAALTLVLDFGERDLIAVQLPLVRARSGSLLGYGPLLVRELDLVLGHLVGPLDRLFAVPSDRELVLAVELHCPDSAIRPFQGEGALGKVCGGGS